MRTALNEMITPGRTRRETRNNAICNDYITLSNKYKCASPNRIFSALAERYGLTVPGIRSIVMKGGLYQPKYAVKRILPSNGGREDAIQ